MGLYGVYVCAVPIHDVNDVFMTYASKMRPKDSAIQVTPAYNKAIPSRKRVKAITCEAFYGLGTPEELEASLPMINNMSSQ